MLMVLVDIAVVIVTIIILVTAHEWGHFLAARMTNVKVLTFSIGFGKPIVTWRGKKTNYQIACIPLGGYVKLAETANDIPQHCKEGPFLSQNLWVRTWIIFAGPLASVLFALVMFWGMLVVGLRSYTPLIAEVMPQSLAAKAGITPGLQITQVGEFPTPNWMSTGQRLIMHLGNRGTLLIHTRDPESKQQHIHRIDLDTWLANIHHKDPIHTLGIVPLIKPSNTFFRQMNVHASFVQAYKEMLLTSQLTWHIISKLITGRLTLSQLRGPIVLAKVAGLAAFAGWGVYMAFLGIVSINIAWINLLPIPGLDGGHLMLYAIEGIRKKPITRPVQELCIRLAIALGIILFGYIISNDLRTIQRMYQQPGTFTANPP